MNGPAGRVAVVFRDDAGRSTRLTPVLAGLGLDAEPVIYSDARAAEARDLLLAMDGILAWVDPLAADGDRTLLDTILREAAEAGAWLGAQKARRIAVPRDIMTRRAS